MILFICQFIAGVFIPLGYILYVGNRNGTITSYHFGWGVIQSTKILKVVGLIMMVAGVAFLIINAIKIIVIN